MRGTGWPESKWEKPKPPEPQRKVALRMKLYDGPAARVIHIVNDLPRWFQEKLTQRIKRGWKKP